MHPTLRDCLCLGGGFKQFLRVPWVTEVHGHSRSHSVPPMGCWRQVHQPTNIACAPQAHVKNRACLRSWVLISRGLLRLLRLLMILGSTWYSHSVECQLPMHSFRNWRTLILDGHGVHSGPTCIRAHDVHMEIAWTIRSAYIGWYRSPSAPLFRIIPMNTWLFSIRLHLLLWAHHRYMYK